MIDTRDWRLQGQEQYLMARPMCHQNYTPYREGWDHDHCEFCSHKISMQEGALKEGYRTLDDYHWVCDDCFKDFYEMFKWIIVKCPSDHETSN